MKSNRQAKIMEIISTSNIETQEQLLQELQNAGFSSTQATISRDIKELRIVKELTSLDFRLQKIPLGGGVRRDHLAHRKAGAGPASAQGTAGGRHPWRPASLAEALRRHLEHEPYPR